ncbi:uncharacterized protein LOC124814061 [Hydra vulgaris]|uniref:uncharacterized protein LOC124814061 n=1 Tax=Hydra vulgaris TaxID=6087 RepID=UPI001F5F49AE|nr:uncharacterized protein LOC124814061 [Hydra vulgaris]
MNPANSPEASPVEGFWENLKMEVYNNNWTTKNLVELVKKIVGNMGLKDVINELELKVSENTVRRCLDIAGLFSYRAAKNPFISEKNRKARLEFAYAHKNWTVEQWSHILWSDESKFNMHHSEGKKKSTPDDSSL